MKKVVRYLLLTYAVLVLCANCLTLSSPLSETSKVVILTWFNFACLSAALLVTLVWQGTCSTTKRQGGLNRLKVLSQKEAEILRIAGKATKSRKETTEPTVRLRNGNIKKLSEVSYGDQLHY